MPHKWSQVQIIRVTVTSNGVQFRCEDDGKVCQSSVRFPRSYFSAFNFSGQPTTFSVQLSALADALRVFAALPHVAVVITETQDHLVLETAEIDGGTTVSMYAHLAILGTSHVADILDHWQPPATEFLANTALLREAVEDLEWPQGHVRVHVQAEPLQVSPCSLPRTHPSLFPLAHPQLLISSCASPPFLLLSPTSFPPI